ncbi:MAG: OsmC family protein [Steroidobacteraceae bacterium]
MNSQELRALQAPIKEAYRKHPESALATSRVEVSLEPATVAVRLAADRPRAAGLHPATGGTGAAACSADMLLESLAACGGVTLLAVATATGVALNGGRISAEGLWDARDTLAVDKTVPVGLQHIKLHFELDGPADPAVRERLVRTAERYCVILQTLRASTSVEVPIGA